MKNFTINEAGQVVEASKFGTDGFYVSANTKTEATTKLLLRARLAERYEPELYVKNGAYALIFPCGEGFSIDKGTLDRVDSQNRVRTLQCSYSPSIREAREDAQNNYYANAEYKAAQ